MDDIEAVAALQDPVRRRLYDHVAAQDHEVGRNEAAEAAGVSRTLAAFHLDRLVAVGLLETASRRLTGRSGPGAGRPAKLYRRAAAERRVVLPPRDYRTPAVLLAEVVEAADADEALQAAARRRGRALAAGGGLAGVTEVLAGRGYEPFREEGPDGPVLRLRNCPFRALAEEFPPLVCGMNLALLEGLTVAEGGLAARMDARPDRCCVVIEPSKNNTH